MKELLPFIVCYLLVEASVAQYNCQVLEVGSICRRACEITQRGHEFPQGSWESQLRYDSAIALCPSFASAWHAKSVPFLKRGAYTEWWNILDHAVQHEPANYLGYRAGCLFDVLRDYERALRDIQKLEEILDGQNLGYSPGGEYHMLVIKAICLKALGNRDSSIQVFDDYFASTSSERIGLFDYLHYGITLFQSGKLDQAISAFQKQLEFYPDLADTYYYLGLIYKVKESNALAKLHLEEAQRQFLKGYNRSAGDAYDISLPDEVYLHHITEQLKVLK